MVNDPSGFPSAYPPVTWLDASGGDGAGAWWWGVDSGGLRQPIGPHGPWVSGAQGQAVVTRATSLIVGPLSASPYKVLSNGQPIPTPRFIGDPMLKRPDFRFTDSVWPDVLKLARSAFWAGWVRSALHWGLGAFLYETDEAGQPLAGTLRLVDPRFLSTERDDGGALCWSIDGGQGNPAVLDRDGSITLGSVVYHLCVLRNPLSSVDTEGMSLGVFAMSPDAFHLGSQIQTYMSGTFRSGIPSGYLKTDQPSMTQEQADDLKSKWLSNHGGDRRSIAVLNATTSFVPLTFSPVDAALGEAKRLSIADVSFAFGLDPTTLNVSLAGSSTYNNVRDSWLNHRDYGLSPWIVAVQDTLSALLAGVGTTVMVDLAQFANPTMKEIVETGAAAVDAGLVTRDEWRLANGYPPLPPDVPQSVPEPLPEPEPEPAEPNVRKLSWRQ